MFKKYDKRTLRKVYNIVEAVGESGFKEEENIDYMISQASNLFFNNADEKILKMNDKQKASFKVQVIEKINECLRQYSEYRKNRENMEKIAISWNNKDYMSKFINIDIYFYINDNLKNGNSENIAENVLKKIYDGICPIDVIEEIKIEDPIYYELIIDDVSNLIYKTIKEILGIKSVKRSEKEKSIIDYKASETKNEIYSLFLENYNITPEELNKNKAVDIMKTLSEISKKQVIREAEENVKNIKDNFMKDAYIEQVKKELGESDDDG